MGPSTEEKFEVKKETLADGTEVETTTQETTTKEEKVIPMTIGGAGGSMTMSSKRTVTSSSSQSGEIPISIGRGGVTAVKSPRPRTLPFAFDNMGGMDMSMPSLNMPNADDMMAQMQKQMEAQMQSMMSGMGSMQGSMQASMPTTMQMTMESSSSTTSQGVEQQMQQQQAARTQQAPQQHQEIHQEFFVPLKQIDKVQKNALAEATAMAKMKDGFFEVVVNIQRFEPEEIKVYLEGQAVMVTAEKKQGNIVCDSYEQKISLPADVDTDRLTSGISRDGILMIRVPRRRSPDRIIPIQFDTKISAVEKAIQKSVQIESMTAEQVQNDLQAANV